MCAGPGLGNVRSEWISLAEPGGAVQSLPTESSRLCTFCWPKFLGLNRGARLPVELCPPGCPLRRAGAPVTEAARGTEGKGPDPEAALIRAGLQPLPATHPCGSSPHKWVLFSWELVSIFMPGIGARSSACSFE